VTAEKRHPVRIGSQPLVGHADVWVAVRKIRAFRWKWHLTAGQAGPTIYGPHYAWTESGARYKAWTVAHGWGDS
jgi:hypothetical protein